MKLDGFGIMADDMAAMIRFYRDVLGFDIKEDENAANVFLEKDGTLFLLYRKTDFEKMAGRKFTYCSGINGHYEIALSVENYAAVDKAYELIKKILKADYTSEADGEKIYFDEYHWVKLMYGSSGQQEVLWILMLAFATILEKNKSFIIIEEPEAHLFPIAQKDVMSLISLMINSTNSKVIITTHSPYILTSTNILLYSQKVENQHTKLNKIVIPKNLRVSYENFAAYKVDNFEKVLESLLDEESHMINTNYIDEVSSITNSELDELITMEIDE